MRFKIEIVPYTLKFKRPAKTSRGEYTDHKIWYVIVRSVDDPERWGVGECAPLFDLSSDYNQDYEMNLHRFCKDLEQTGVLNKEALRSFPSILFGLETALRQFDSQSFSLWNTSFSKGQEGIPINGLIWMGDFDYMSEQIEAKIQQGFHCIKLKIGAINFEDELTLLKRIRKRFSSQDITLRVDANGAFSANEALEKLKRLSEFDLHSIEQPIRAGQWDEMARLCDETPLPIALDEELIGVNNVERKKLLLETIDPQYIILKPTLHGGISGASEWIEMAEKLNIAWWATSALESNVGLNAVAQWVATFNNPLPQGLGTGALYTNNVKLPVFVEGEKLYFDPNGDFIRPEDLR